MEVVRPSRWNLAVYHLPKNESIICCFPAPDGVCFAGPSRGTVLYFCGQSKYVRIKFDLVLCMVLLFCFAASEQCGGDVSVVSWAVFRSDRFVHLAFNFASRASFFPLESSCHTLEMHVSRKTTCQSAVK
ncbi:hypothetical protein GALMADRAFT_1076419 [Galerina marginata CBS 339.88]|uniref:Uncharacterized protein n=1 Tax=Galerina marginata (strain CBS 339.88) TaxID=685588 RepID=A0A067SL63_GALM3|nr:hypothetical protein GALMADRAFT_1076419 [Galerina marginata CBS 339.88]